MGLPRVTGVAGVAGALVAAAVVAGCSRGSDGGPVTVTASYASSGTSTPTPASTSAPSGPDATGSGPATGTPSATASIAQPASPSASGGGTGAWSLTRAAPGAPAQGRVASLRCGQDGSVTSDTVVVVAGGGSLTLLGADGAGSSLTVGGTSDVDAAGGTFTGRNATVAVTFTWVC